jgi:death-on-curing protein
LTVPHSWIFSTSVLHAPQAGFGEVEFYPDFADKAAVLMVRIAKNHPLPDRSERLARQSLTMFCVLNGYLLEVAADELPETEVATWLTEQLQPLDSI